MNSLARRLGVFIGFGLLALFLIGLSGAVWGGLLYLNFRKTPSFPWALLGLFAYLWLYWRYLAGWGWPSRTSARRRALLRAHNVSPAAYGWSVVAGLLAV